MVGVIGRTNIEKGKEIQSSISMIVILISLSMLFATLLLGYLIYRVRASEWPPMGMSDIPSTYAILSTLFIFASSLTFGKFEQLNKESKSLIGTIWLKITALLSLLFCVSQSLLWMDLQSSGISTGTGILGSMLYGFTWIHAAHIAVGIILLFRLLNICRKADENNFSIKLNIKNTGLFWHFLGVVWLIIFITLFVI